MQIKSGLKAIAAGAILGAMMSPFVFVSSLIGVMIYDWAGELAWHLAWALAIFPHYVLLRLILEETAPGRALLSMRKNFLTSVSLAAVLWCVILIPTSDRFVDRAFYLFFVLFIMLWSFFEDFGKR